METVCVKLSAAAAADPTIEVRLSSSWNRKTVGGFENWRSKEERGKSVSRWFAGTNSSSGSASIRTNEGGINDLMGHHEKR